MVILGVWVFLLSEVPSYHEPPLAVMLIFTLLLFAYMHDLQEKPFIRNTPSVMSEGYLAHKKHP
jgi:hypothetical protein